MAEAQSCMFGGKSRKAPEVPPAKVLRLPGGVTSLPSATPPREESSQSPTLLSTPASERGSTNPAVPSPPVHSVPKCFACTRPALAMTGGLTCTICKRPSCGSCSVPCELCGTTFCKFCTLVNYSGKFEKTVCFPCDDMLRSDDREGGSGDRVGDDVAMSGE